MDMRVVRGKPSKEVAKERLLSVLAKDRAGVARLRELETKREDTST